jgi:hypothetical protein
MNVYNQPVTLVPGTNMSDDANITSGQAGLPVTRVPDPDAADGAAVGGVPDCIVYAGPPVETPPALQNIVVDVNGRQWQYFGGAWN